MRLLLLLLVLQIPTTSHEITLSWQPESVTSFYLFRSKDNISFSRIAIVPGTQTSYKDVNVRVGIKYYYKMKAYCSTCKIHFSNNSNTVNFTIP